MPITTEKAKPTTLRIVEVPVKLHVYKVLTCLYGDVVKAHHNTVTGKALFNLIGDVLQEELDFPAPVLRGIKVEFNYRVARFYNRYGLYKVFELGGYFEGVVQMMLFQHIVAQMRKGGTATAAIDDFYRLYDIDEDDYARDCALRNWQFRKGLFNGKT
jgi:hypothetical protein